MVSIETARRIGKAGGLIIVVASLILFLYSFAIGWGSQHPLTIAGFLMFAGGGTIIASMSSRRVIFDAEDAAKRAALAGYEASDKLKMKYVESASRAILLWFVLIPIYTASLMLYTYLVTEPAGMPSSGYLYAFVGWSIPVVYIFTFVFIVCFYMRGHELRKFMWRVYGLAAKKRR